MIDTFDKKILSALQKNARISNVDLAELINLSTAATYRRVKNLENSNIISGYTAIINKNKINLSTQVILRVTLDGQDNQKTEDFENEVRKIPNIMGCYFISGDYDYLIRIIIKDINSYEKLHKEKLSKLPHIHRLHSNFVLKEVVSKVNLEIEN